MTMNRREWLTSAAVGVTAASFPGRKARAATGGNRRILFLTKSAGYEHSVVRRAGNALSHAERVFTQIGAKHGFDITCTKNGSVFLSDDIDQYDAFAFYTTGDLRGPSKDGGDGMTDRGKARLLELVHGGKGFVGSHCASDTFHSPGDPWKNQARPDPYIAMLGGEFISHGKQQRARMTVASPQFPGAGKWAPGFKLLEEWYSLKNFAPDLHVILREEAYGMEGKQYMRPAFPATWARRHGTGRVFYTSMGHREDVWTNPTFQSMLLGGLAWATGKVDADVKANIDQVTPYGSVLPVS